MPFRLCAAVQARPGRTTRNRTPPCGHPLSKLSPMKTIWLSVVLLLYAVVLLGGGAFAQTDSQRELGRPFLDDLFQAVREGSTEDVRALLQMRLGPDVNDTSHDGAVLFTAVENDNAEIVRLLLEAGADTTVR